MCAGKRRFPTHEQAQMALVEAILRRNRGSPNRSECRLYHCPLCKGWHLTSRPR
jgi:hypothetical protein